MLGRATFLAPIGRGLGLMLLETTLATDRGAVLATLRIIIAAAATWAKVGGYWDCMLEQASKLRASMFEVARMLITGRLIR